MGKRDGERAELEEENARLRSQVALLSDALEHMRHGLCMFDADGRIAFNNRRYPEVIGLPPERVQPGVHARELIAMAMEAGFYPPDRSIDELEAAFWDNLACAGEPRGQIKRGGRTFRVQPGRAPDGKLVATFEDITERLNADIALRRSEQRLRLVQEATGLADFETDPHGVSLCSDKFFEQCGLPVPPNHRIDFPTWLEIVHPDDRVRMMEEVDAALSTETSFSCEFRIVRQDNGDIRWISSRTLIERDSEGRLVGTVGAHHDVTERREAENALRLNEQRLRLVQEATGLADFEAGPDGVAHFSPNVLKQLGLPDDHSTHLRVEDWIHLVHPDDREIVNGVVRSVPDKDSHNCEFRIIRADNGEVRWIASSLMLERDANGKILRSIGAHLDITEHRQVEAALRESEERFRLAAEAAGLGVWDYDASLDRREWSGRLREIFGIPAHVTATLERATACVHASHRARFTRLLAQVREGTIERIRDSVRIRRADDREARWIEINAWRTHKAGGKVRRVIMTARDVTEEKTAEQRVRWSASHDGLTRLANRSLFQEKLDEAVGIAREKGLAVGVLVLDLDHFKQVNDTLGHDVGDALLKMVAGRLREVARSNDTVARLGGDEFAIVVPELRSEIDLIQLARRIQDRMREPFVHQGRLLDCRISSGAAMFPEHGTTTEEVLKNADMALYAAKAAGRGTMMMFEPHMRDDIRQRTAMVQQARTAIRDDQMVPYYQPKLDLVSGAVEGFEALLRWRMPNGRIGLPAALQAAFEDLEVAAAISDRMIERVISDMRRWLDRGIPFRHVAVNASAAEFRRDNFAERVLEQLRRAQIPTHCFQLEVTETVFLGRGAEYVHRALALLSAQGVKIALDDFGTGYASLRHLKEFPVDIIKIDRSFVRDMEADPGDEAIVRAVINLGKSLNISVVAEGIEAESQAERLLDFGCDFGQGFVFSPAVGASRVPGLIARLAEAARTRPARPRLPRLVATRD
jgi:diguanylate cyclase (GGDEF)-like protein/PAS domain S-box-containing protein